jgi:hypothetical protein
MAMRILQDQIKVHGLIHTIEKWKGGGKNKNVNRSQKAQQQNNFTRT